MSLLEGRSFKESVKEVTDKFPKTWKVGIIWWPIVQTINFSFIKEKNRVIYVCVCSFVWTIFMGNLSLNIDLEFRFDIYLKNHKTEKFIKSEFSQFIIPLLWNLTIAFIQAYMKQLNISEINNGNIFQIRRQISLKNDSSS